MDNSGIGTVSRAPTREEERGRLSPVLHEFRKQVDTLIQRISLPYEGIQGSVWSHVYSREIELVKTKLQEAKMWTGKCLEQLGSELPKEFQDKAE